MLFIFDQMGFLGFLGSATLFAIGIFILIISFVVGMNLLGLIFRGKSPAGYDEWVTKYRGYIIIAGYAGFGVFSALGAMMV